MDGRSRKAGTLVSPKTCLCPIAIVIGLDLDASREGGWVQVDARHRLHLAASVVLRGFFRPRGRGPAAFRVHVVRAAHAPVEVFRRASRECARQTGGQPQRNRLKLSEGSVQDMPELSGGTKGRVPHRQGDPDALAC